MNRGVVSSHEDQSGQPSAAETGGFRSVRSGSRLSAISADLERCTSLAITRQAHTYSALGALHIRQGARAL